MIDLTVIIVSFNTKDLTLSCIKSVLKDTSVKSKEIIVIDNGSTDGSLEGLEGLGKSIKLIKNDNNLGFSKANNQGLEIAKGNYKLLLNSDTKVKNGSLGGLLEFAARTTDIGVVGARLLNKDGSIQPSCFNLPTISRAVTQYWLNNGKPLDKFSPTGNQPQRVEAVVGAAFLITPLAFKKLGGLDERFFFFYEDLDYCRKVKNIGLKVYYLPQSEIYHYHGASGNDIAKSDNQWRRLIPSSKIYHGVIKHYLFNFVLWSGQKFARQK